MELMQAIRGRRSIRVFDGRPIDRPVLEEIVGAASYAPSRMNVQPWHFHVATGEARQRVAAVMAMTTAYLQEYVDVLGPEHVEHAARFYADLGGAPVIIGISSPRDDDVFEARDFAISVGAAIQNLLLAVEDNGLGACSLSVPVWIRDQLAEVFEVDAEWEIMSLIVMGHADESPHPRDRHTDVVTFLT
jgi:nitroreductase